MVDLINKSRFGGFQQNVIEGRVTAESKLCFGAVLFLENSVRGGCRSNVMFRFGLMRQEFKLNDLRKDESVYESFDGFLSGVSY